MPRRAGRTVRRTARRVAVAAFVTIIVAASAHAQEITGSVSGTIKDQSGAVLPAATVTVRGGRLLRTGRASTRPPPASTAWALLPPGTYSVEAKLPSFSAQVRKAVEVAIDAETRVDFVLGPPAVEESVDVVAEAPVVDTRRSEVSDAHHGDGHRRPAPERPRVRGPREARARRHPGHRRRPRRQPRPDLDLRRARRPRLSFLVDGADNNDPLNGGPFVRYTQDSIQEFEVITTGYEAQFGRAQGGVINIVTRSGKQRLAGRAFLFARNDSPRLLERPRPGGARARALPVGRDARRADPRDKAFFFGAFEMLDETRGINIDLSTHPRLRGQRLATPGGSEDFAIAPETLPLERDAEVRRQPRSAASACSCRATAATRTTAGRDQLAHPGTTALPSAAAASARHRELRHRAPHRGPRRLDVPRELGVVARRAAVGTNLDRDEPLRADPASCSPTGFQQTGAPFNGKQDRSASKRFQLGAELHLEPGRHAASTSSRRAGTSTTPA